MTIANTTEICSNCCRPINKHRPWCATYKVKSETLKAGDVIDHPVFGPTELISVYSRLCGQHISRRTLSVVAILLKPLPKTS